MFLKAVHLLILLSRTTSLKAVHISDVPSLDYAPAAAISRCFSSSTPFPRGRMDVRSVKSVAANVRMAAATMSRADNFVVIGHRGHGMNLLCSPDPRMRSFMENTILSFNSAANHPLDFIEFDVQVTRDDCPIIFHDDIILSADNGKVYEKRVTELTSQEFLSYGMQREPGKVGKSLLRKTRDGKVVNWDVEKNDALCTLQEAFQKVKPSLGFNIELKFDDCAAYQEEHLLRVLQTIMKVVSSYADRRPIIFSSFHPDAAILTRKLQRDYPVFFLTDGGTRIFRDTRRNSLEEAIKVCIGGGLQGIVSEVTAVYRNPGAVSKIKESNLSLLTYGNLNNDPEAVYAQHRMGINGVIVDLVREITEAVAGLIKPPKDADSY
ncbi:hypothetical protein MLD38_024567 [Melastoma candidum]|uniref:Uncharacterized protein n=1 Tax=Melastoma candidum TaxID=119954 RepID=A0ACB9NZH2_9MYRT|nr:hypothetical protein MLD38_024567 [Melastoma candidum]